MLMIFVFSYFSFSNQFFHLWTGATCPGTVVPQAPIGTANVAPAPQYYDPSGAEYHTGEKLLARQAQIPLPSFPAFSAAVYSIIY